MDRSPVIGLASPSTHSDYNDASGLGGRSLRGTSLSPHQGEIRRLFSKESSPGRFCAPAPDADSSSDSEGPEPTPSFSIHAPLTDSDSDDEFFAQSRRRSSIGVTNRPASALEVALAETTTRLSQQLQLQAQRKVSGLQRALLDIEAQESLAAEAAALLLQQEFNALAATDRQVEARRTQEREQLISSLRTVHEKQAEKAAQTVAELEAAARQKEEARERAAAAAKAKMEAAKAQVQAKAEEEARKKENKAQLAANAAKLAAELASKPAVAVPPASSQHGICSAARSALEFQQRCAGRLALAKESVRPFVEDRAMKDVKRSIDKFVTLNVQQISATLDQVRQKAEALTGFISKHHDLQRTYALLTLAGKLLSQCEVQITRLHSFAFPLAEVAVAVAAAHPDFVDLLLARLHDACPLSVPIYYGFRQGGDDLEYLRLMKYKITEEEERGKIQISKESTDEYMGRMQGYVMLYAAVTQSDNPANPHGLTHAWEYLARLLNSLPPNRLTAAALDAFLKVAGFKMAAFYKRQFTKLLDAVETHFIAELAQANDPDARAVCTRLQTYLKTRQFTKAPEGRDMPRHDASSYDRA